MHQQYSLEYTHVNGIPDNIEEVGALILKLCIAKKKRGYHCFELPLVEWGLNDVLVVMDIILAYEVLGLPEFDVVFMHEKNILQITTWCDPNQVYSLDEHPAVKKRRMEAGRLKVFRETIEES